MNLRIGIRAVVIGCMASFAALAQSTGDTSAPAGTKGMQSSFAPERALIEEVLEVEDAGYRFDGYVVRWHGARVLISDPLSEGHFAVGDSIRFLVTRHDLNGQRVLNFISTEHDLSGQHTPPALSSSSVSSRTAMATVEEVLTAEDGGYRFRAYIGRWHENRVGFADPLSQHSHLVGEQLEVVATTMSVGEHRVLTFIVPPRGTDRAPPATATSDTGILEEVVSGKVDGDSYVAYLLRWHGSTVALATQDAAIAYQPGDGVPLQVSRIPSVTGSGGALRFATGIATEPDATNELANFSSNASFATGVVERVLAAQVDDYRYRAYIVPWHGALVVVDDVFATTHYKAGDQIPFVVGRVITAGKPYEMFLLFDFPCPQGSTRCKAPVPTDDGKTANEAR